MAMKCMCDCTCIHAVKEMRSLKGSGQGSNLYPLCVCRCTVYIRCVYPLCIQCVYADALCVCRCSVCMQVHCVYAGVMCVTVCRCTMFEPPCSWIEPGNTHTQTYTYAYTHRQECDAGKKDEQPLQRLEVQAHPHPVCVSECI